jgi:hypothetical protein
MSFNPGGGGISSATDVALSNPAAGEFLGYDSTISKWKNLPATGGSSALPFILVASKDATAAVKAAADYVCDGTADQTEINLAISDAAALVGYNAGMPAGAQQAGKVLLTGGRFNISGAILMRTAVWLAGSGWLTELRAVTCNDAGVITLNAPNDHLCRVSDLWLNGNFSSGGTCNAIDFDMSSSGVTTGYPDTNPDSYHMIHDLYVGGFTGGTRHGVYLHASTTANNRGNMIYNLQMRNFSGNGIYLSASSDSFIQNCHVGTVTGTGIYVNTGNTKVNNCKTFYCDTYGFYFASGRGAVVGCESQDNAIGFMFDGSPYVASGIVCDTSLTCGIQVSSSQLQLNGFDVFLRSGGRYATQTQGLFFDAAYSDCTVVGFVNPSGITTPISGSLASASRNFMRVSDGTTMVSVN